MNVSIDQIDKQISQAIDKRFVDTNNSYELATQIVSDSKKIQYECGIEYGKLIITITNFIRAKQDHVFEFLIEGYVYFKENKQEKGYLLVLDTLGGYYDKQGDYEKALHFLNEGIKASKAHTYKEGKADILSTQGKIFLRIKSFDKAIESFEKSFEIRKSLDLKMAQASSLNLLGRTFALKKEFEKSEKYYLESIEIRKAINDIVGITWSFIGIASMYEMKGEFPKSILYYKKALDHNSYCKDLSLDFHISKGMGEIYLNQSDIKSAKEYILPLIEMAENINSKPLLYQTNELLAVYYEKQGKLEKAYGYLKKFIKLKEEVINTSTQNKIANKQAEFEIINAKKEAEIYHLRNVELKEAYDQIEEKNNEITDSIKYAYRIQKALIPEVSIIEEFIPNHFIFYLPKDIVSGDYYWFDEKDGKLIIAAADCTGHGVPGALMSMLGITFLTEIVTNISELKANLILNELRKRIIKSLKQKGLEGESKDGMDIALVIFDPIKKTIQFSGAYNPIYLIRNSELIEYKADRMPIGIHQRVAEQFTNYEIILEKDDIIYLFSDGFPDQFGGVDNKKYKYKPFKEFLLSIYKNDLKDQKLLLKEEFEKWKGNNEQIDDIIILGIKP